MFIDLLKPKKIPQNGGRGSWCLVAVVRCSWGFLDGDVRCTVTAVEGCCGDGASVVTRFRLWRAIWWWWGSMEEGFPVVERVVCFLG